MTAEEPKMIFFFVSRLYCRGQRSEGEQGAGGYQARHSCLSSAEKGQERRRSDTFLNVLQLNLRVVETHEKENMT